MSQKPFFSILPLRSKRGKNEFSGRNRKRHVLTCTKNKLHAKNQKYLSHIFPGKHSETDGETEIDKPDLVTIKERGGPECFMYVGLI